MVAGNSFPFSGIEAFVEIDDDGGLFCGAAARRLDPSLCTGTADSFTLSIDNPCFQLPVGRVWRLWGEENDEELVVEIEVLDKTQLIGDVETRVVLEREWADGEQTEVSHNSFAQAEDGTVCYPSLIHRSGTV